MSSYQQLMQEAYLAHKTFTDEFEKWRNGWLDKNKRKGNIEPESVTTARNDFFVKLELLYQMKIEPLERKFHESPHLAFPELVEFLSIDIPAHRTGYAKENFLRWLKSVDLSKSEIEEVQRVALKMCETQKIRREFRDWCRLMVKFADAEFVSKLKNFRNSGNFYTRLKAKRMSELIEKHRADLRVTQ